MPQLSLYIDEETLAKIKSSAAAEKLSVSKLVTRILSRSLSSAWTPEFLATYGAITDPSFVEPTEIAMMQDLPRAEFSPLSHPAQGGDPAFGRMTEGEI